MHGEPLPSARPFIEINIPEAARRFYTELWVGGAEGGGEAALLPHSGRLSRSLRDETARARVLRGARQRS